MSLFALGLNLNVFFFPKKELLSLLDLEYSGDVLLLLMSWMVSSLWLRPHCLECWTDQSQKSPTKHCKQQSMHGPMYPLVHWSFLYFLNFCQVCTGCRSVFLPTMSIRIKRRLRDSPVRCRVPRPPASSHSPTHLIRQSLTQKPAYYITRPPIHSFSVNFAPRFGIRNVTNVFFNVFNWNRHWDGRMPQLNTLRITCPCVAIGFTEVLKLPYIPPFQRVYLRKADLSTLWHNSCSDSTCHVFILDILRLPFQTIWKPRSLFNLTDISVPKQILTCPLILSILS